MIRHTLATLAYRLEMTLRDAPPEFASFLASDSSRTPVEILAHMGDLMDWALSHVNGAETWKDSAPLEWPTEIARFKAALQDLDTRFAAGQIQCDEHRLFQGPIADALTHTGQIAFLRRMYRSPVPPQNYFKAEI